MFSSSLKKIRLIFEFFNVPSEYNKICDTVFFTGCSAYAKSIILSLDYLAQQYQFTNIKYVFRIVPPHHEKNFWEDVPDGGLSLVENKPYEYRVLSSGMSLSNPLNIGIPRFKLKPSEFELSSEFYGVIRHSKVEDFLPALNYLIAYFRKVAFAGRNSVVKPIKVLAIGMNPRYRQIIIEVAQFYSITVDFCDQFPDYRLP